MERLKLDFKVSDEVAFEWASRMIYTPSLEAKDSANANISEGVAGKTMLGKLGASRETAHGDRARDCGDPIISPFHWILRRTSACGVNL
jgi:hypothetical protein